jgi:hypothetical protein
MNTGETKDKDVFTRSAATAKRLHLEEKFAKFGNTNTIKLQRKLKRLKKKKQEEKKLADLLALKNKQENKNKHSRGPFTMIYTAKSGLQPHVENSVLAGPYTPRRPFLGV